MISDLKDCSAMVRSLNYSTYTGSSTPSISDSQEKVRVFVATWNVGGKAPHSAMNLEDDLLRAEDRSDVYVLGFQEIVPLNAGNVLVIEDNEPAARWLSLINQALNKPSRFSSKIYPSIPPNCGNSSLNLSTSTDSVSQDSRNSNVLFLKKPSLKAISKTYKTEQGKRIKTCNCHTEAEKKYYRESCFKCPRAYFKEELLSSDEDEELNTYTETEVVSNLAATRQRYGLISCKQMVGIFVTIWARRELVQYISHLRVDSIGRGIMGYLGNKGCISISMCVYKTSFCIMCSHLASGEKEGDERRRNSDVIEILRNTQFPKICKTPYRRIPEKILDHDRVIWLGDLNYRISLSYNETRNLLQDSNWDSLLEKDQLRMGRKAGRVFKGWNEGKIYFAPTYKYSSNSDAYAGETITSKKNRRTPAWCDRILWHGSGIEQLSYVRGESRFSDHRPVSSVFLVNVEVADATLKKASSAPNMKIDVEELLPPSRSSKHHGKSSCSIFHEES